MQEEKKFSDGIGEFMSNIFQSLKIIESHTSAFASKLLNDQPDANGLIPCPNCGGDGYLCCKECDGVGYTLIRHGIGVQNQMKQCVICNGTGDVSCEKCQGSGKIKYEEPIKEKRTVSDLKQIELEHIQNLINNHFDRVPHLTILGKVKLIVDKINFDRQSNIIIIDLKCADEVLLRDEAFDKEFAYTFDLYNYPRIIINGKHYKK